MESLRRRLAERSNGSSYLDLADKAQSIALRAWGPQAPEIDEDWIRQVRTRNSTPPADGSRFRAMLAAHEVPLVEALDLMGYWPDLRLGTVTSVSPQDLLVEAARSFGLRVRVVVSDRNRLIVELG